MAAMHAAENDNNPPGRLVPIVGLVAEDGVIIITDPTWRADAGPDLQALFPNEVREA